ncbi:MAG: peptidoglycan DD-metalloendopeptidase family protein [Streptosporangiales bacterium]|nr:peptidoglycan DD-metalloendopeptidase family protein [Streptosporangiales bacterium]
MKRPERPRSLFAVLVATVALVLSSGTAAAAPTANGDAMTGKNRSGEKKSAKKVDSKDKNDTRSPDEIRGQIKRIADEYEQSQDNLDRLTHQRTTLTRRISATKKLFAERRSRVAQTAEIAYTNGSSDSTVLALTHDSGPNELVQRMTTMSMMSATDDAALRAADRERKRLEIQVDNLERAKKDARSEQSKIAKQRKKLNAALLEAAQALAKRKNGKASRGAKFANGGACPVGDPLTISDTWGASRSGGRAHQGTDMLAPMGTPVFAVEDGTINRAGNNGLGGIVIILQGKSGDQYYYAHNSANLVNTGQKVVAGEQIAKVGMTGNAQGTVPHVHFELWPGGGSAINPYPFVQALCGN